MLALYYGILGVLSLFGVHRMVLVMLFLRHRKRAAEASAAADLPTDLPADLPIVTVQLPLYNEMYVARRLIDAAVALDYPRDRLEIQVLDDSTDETTEVVAHAVERYRALGYDVKHLRREVRTGFKAGALAAGTAAARGELLAVFDADFVPQADFLRRAVPHFADPGVGMVQARWDHLNRDYSLLTRVQAILLDGHFLVEQAARSISGRFFNFNGTAGLWRREAIPDAGGWQHDTLTEDLDLSYRAQLAGWKFVYLRDVAVPSELPVDVNGFKSQQYRWAKGSIQTAKKLLGRVLRSRQLPLRVRFEAFVHLTNNVSYVLMVALSVLMFPAMAIRRGGSVAAILLVDLPLFAAATLSVLVFYTASQAWAGRRWWRDLKDLPALMAVGIGLSVNQTRAVVSGWRHQGGEFVRTPKYRIERRGEDWQKKRYRAGRSLAIVFEGLLAAWFLACFVYAAVDGMWASLPFLWLFLQGYGFVFLLSVLPAWRAKRASFGRLRSEAVEVPVDTRSVQ
ncbi:MAG TPA: glycosyltransferase [Thermoanaerobaculia bacterium]|nr:glycosyltransferase [Thermoanaerobaculia bacterium]